MVALTIKFMILVVISDKLNGNKSNLEKEFSYELNKNKEVLYDNDHVLDKDYILNYFSEEIKGYTEKYNIELSDIIVESFEIINKTENVEVYFKNEEDEETYTLYPTIMAYVYPLSGAIPQPTTFKGTLIGDTTIKWEWENDGYLHYIIDENKNYIAQLPLDKTNYIESNLEYDSAYSRRLISYDATRQSIPSVKHTIITNEKPIDNGELINYSESRIGNYSEEEILKIDERLEAFRSGTGYGKDCLLNKPEDDRINTIAPLTFNLIGKLNEKINFYPKVSFEYRHKLSCKYKERTREGSVTLNSVAYPIENAKIRLYQYAIKEVNVSYKITAKCSYLIKNSTGDYSSKTKTITVTGTYPLTADSSNVSYVNGFAKMNPVNEQIGTKTIGKLIEEAANNDSEIRNAVSGHTEYYDFRIYDNYGTDADEKYTNTMTISNDGTFRICANTSGRITASNTLHAKGYADLQLYSKEIIKSCTVNSYDHSNGYELFSSSEINSNLTCIADSSKTLAGNNSAVVTKVETVEKGSNITVSNSSSAITVTIGKTLKSGSLTYNFTDANHCKVMYYSELFTGGTVSNDAKYKIITTITSCSNNAYYNSNNQCKTGTVISVTSNLYGTLVLFTKPKDIEKTYTAIYPPKTEDPFHGVVNGVEDDSIMSSLGKDDMIVRAYKFPLDERFYDINYSLETKVLNPSTATLDYKFLTTGTTTSKRNADVITFSSNYISKINVSSEDIISSQYKEVEITDKSNKVIETELTIDEKLISKYTDLSLNVESDNIEILVLSKSDNIKILNGKCKVQAVVKALKQANSKWSPEVHSGYYYINQDEYFIYSNESPTAESRVTNSTIKYGTVEFDIVLTTNDEKTFIRSYSIKIKLDAEKHLIINDIYEFIDEWINSIGLTKLDIKNIEIKEKSPNINLEYESISISTDNTPQMEDIFSKWKRFSHGTSTEDETKCWQWDSVNKRIECTKNTDSYVGFVSDDELERYKVKLRVSSRCDFDDDIMGFVIAYKEVNGKEHTLSAIRAMNKPVTKYEGTGYTSFQCARNQWCLVYNCGDNSTVRFIEPKGYLLDDTAPTKWMDYLPEGSRLEIERNKNIITAKCSEYGQAEITEKSAITINLEDYDFLEVFVDTPCSYGFSCMSQKYATFDEVEIIDYKNIIGSVVASSKEIEKEEYETDYIAIVGNEIELSPLPQQYCPVIIEDGNSNSLKYVSNINGCNGDLEIVEEFTVEHKNKVLMLSYNNIEKGSVKVEINDIEYSDFTIENNAIILGSFIETGGSIKVSYKIEDSFIIDYDIENDKVKLKINSEKDLSNAIIAYETSKDSNTRLLEHLSLNPVHNSRYAGYFYINYDDMEPYYINIHSTVKSLFYNVEDRTNLYIEILDKDKNPVEDVEVELNTNNGVIETNTNTTDINGIIPATYYAGEIGESIIEARCGNIVNTLAINIKERVL